MTLVNGGPRYLSVERPADFFANNGLLPMPELTDAELRERELRLQEQQLELEQKKLYVEFAKYGFAGTLTASIIGLLAVVGLAALNAFTDAKIETWGIVAVAVIVLLGAIAFGYFSLWELPKIAGQFSKTKTGISLGPGNKDKDGS